MQSTLNIRLDAAESRELRIPPASQSFTVAELLRREGHPLNTRCGQKGVCDGCLVELIDGPLARTDNGDLIHSNGQPQLIKGCLHRVPSNASVTLRIPPRSRLAYQPQVQTEFRVNVTGGRDPLWRQVPLQCDESIIESVTPEPLCRSVAGQHPSDLPVRMTEAAWQRRCAHREAFGCQATLEYRPDHWLITWTEPRAYELPVGATIDIGTTTVVVMLVDLRDGRVLARAADFNQQFRFGDDVLTRIGLCAQEGMLAELQRAVVERTIAPLIRQAMEQITQSDAKPLAGPAKPKLVSCAIAGNTTMLHILANVDPTPMGVVPFTPRFLEHRVIDSDQLPGWPVDLGTCAVHLLPGASAYVGADLTAGALASGLIYDDGPSLLVDVGTNGEILFKHGDRLLGCATAAGPAFEGAGLACGIRAGDGAISHIRLRSYPFAMEFEHIGPPRHPIVGLCGSAYIDFLAEARRIGLLTVTGRFNPDAVPDARNRFIPGHGGDRLFKITTSRHNDIVVAESDVARLLPAKAAIAAGILILLNRAGVEPKDVKRLYLAGGFGTHMVTANAIACGMLPGFAPEQIQSVGNTSLAGAYLSMMDAGALRELGRIGERVQIIELNKDPEFENIYIDQLQMPEA